METIGTTLMTELEAARYLRMSRSFLAGLRMIGRREEHTQGPPFIRLGRAVRYSMRDLDQWIEEHRVAN